MNNNKIIWGWTQQEATLQDIQSCVGLGWSNLLSQLIDDLFSLGWDGTLYQVKEKFSMLRFYIGTGTNAVHDRISRAQQESGTICEDCGAPGEIRDLSWYRTLCDKCLGDAT